MARKILKREDIRDILVNDIPNWQLANVWNEFCDRNNYIDERIYEMSDLNEYLQGLTPIEVIDSVSDGDFTTCSDFFQETIYGLSSFDDVSSHIDLDELVDDIFDDEETYGCDEIGDYFFEYWHEHDKECFSMSDISFIKAYLRDNKDKKYWLDGNIYTGQELYESMLRNEDDNIIGITIYDPVLKEDDEYCDYIMSID